MKAWEVWLFFNPCDSRDYFRCVVVAGHRNAALREAIGEYDRTHSDATAERFKKMEACAGIIA